jgi:hypothetical protein
MTPAFDNLKTHQRQLDADGCEVGVSRQALDEVLALVERLHGERALYPSKDRSGFSSGGMNIEGDHASMLLFREMHHNATTRLPWFERDYKRLVEQNTTLTGHLLVLLQDTWPYLHATCTIQSIKDRWLAARKFLGGDFDGVL